MSGNLQGPEWRIVLVGKSGMGKSAVANTILGSPVFEFKLASVPFTRTCQREEAVLKGRKVVVVDMPGFLDTGRPERGTWVEVRKCIKFCTLVPHIILHVMCLGCFTQQEKDVVCLIKEIFSLKGTDYMIILFTHKADLEGKTLEEFIAQSYAGLKEHMYHYGNRFLAFENKAGGVEYEAQVGQLMAMIDTLVQKNRATLCYTEEMLKADKEHFAKKWGSSWLSPFL